MKKILLATIAIIALSFGVLAQSNQSGVITVEGKSSVKLIPEEISFTVNFNIKDENYQKCADLSVEKIDEIKSLFIKNGIDEELIKTNSFSIREVQKYDQELRKTVFDGYEANIPITIKTKKDNKKNDKIFELIKDNLKSNFNMNFTLSKEQMEAVKEKLIRLAVDDAKQKATIIAESASIKLSGIKAIQYGEPRTVNTYNAKMELMQFDEMPMLARSSANITSVLSPDEVEMRTDIVISWQIENN